ncbi:MAG: pyruvate kinase [Candidatus Krumholzibacteriia bacterium]
MLSLEELHRELLALRHRAVDAEREFAPAIAAVPEAWRESARNLAHYLGVRRGDIRALQIQLGTMGLSSLGRLEAHVLAGIEAVLLAVARMAEPDRRPDGGHAGPLDFKWGDSALAQHTSELLGPPRGERLVRIMVTMPTAAAERHELVRDLISAGMNVMRINSAHDDPAAWSAMVANARRATEETGHACRVLVDLCGPKLRTGAIEPGPPVVRLRPRRDECGRVITAALAWLGPAAPPIGGVRTAVHLPVDQEFVDACAEDDEVRFRDLNGRKRRLKVTGMEPSGIWAECVKGAYVGPGIELRLERRGREIARRAIGAVPPLPGAIALEAGDRLVLTADQAPGRPARRDRSGAVNEAARIPCTLATVFTDAAVGDPIAFDDGKLAGRVERISGGEITVLIERTPPGGAKLRADKGINLPATRISAPALSGEDLDNLDFIAEHADIVGLSFVHEPADIERLQSELHARGRDDIAIVLKIETRAAFESLVPLLFAGLKSPPFGVMVARGDLGVELGFDRLAEVQEQILWLCEAAHVPVIWATQVLENLVKTGMPSRAEVTDAAMSGRAECVMLNKGPFVVEGVRFLDAVLARMREHHHKKTPMLRRLKVSEGRYGMATGEADA